MGAAGLSLPRNSNRVDFRPPILFFAYPRADGRQVKHLEIGGVV